MRVRGDTGGILASRSGCLEYTEVSKDIVEYFGVFYSHTMLCLLAFSLLPLARCSTSHVCNELYLIILVSFNFILHN